MSIETIPRWLWRAALTENPGRRKQARGEIAAFYQDAVREQIIYMGYCREDAEDLTQGFFSSKIVQSRFLEKFNPNQSFRKYLRTVLMHYVQEQRRKEHSQKRHPKGKILSLEGQAEGSRIEPVDSTNQPSRFDYVWARGLARKAADAVHVSLREHGKLEDWDIFYARIVGPLLDGTKPVSGTVLAERYGKHEGTISHTVSDVRLQYRHVLRKIIREYVTSEAEVDEEINDLIRILS